MFVCFLVQTSIILRFQGRTNTVHIVPQIDKYGWEPKVNIKVEKPLLWNTKLTNVSRKLILQYGNTQFLFIRYAITLKIN